MGVESGKIASCWYGNGVNKYQVERISEGKEGTRFGVEIPGPQKPYVIGSIQKFFDVEEGESKGGLKIYYGKAKEPTRDVALDLTDKEEPKIAEVPMIRGVDFSDALHIAAQVCLKCEDDQAARKEIERIIRIACWIERGTQ
jgi:hypothetical protein